jgi:hypothetical protein
MAKIKFLRGSGGGRPLEGHKGKGNSLSIIKKDKKPKLTNAQRTTVTVAAAGAASAASARAKEALNFVMSQLKKREQG